jgi:RNA polymerase sigma factor (sigma-70 family)
LAALDELPEHRLQALDDEALVDYMRRAREAGRHDAMKPAIAVLVYGYFDTLRARALAKLPTLEDAEDVASEATASAIVSAFDGKSVGEFRSWLHTILTRRIADYYEARKRRPETTALPSENEGDENVWGDEPSVPFAGDGVHARDCIQQAYEEIEDPRHRQVIDLYLFGPHTAGETADIVGDGMTEANVHQISSRFQKRVKELL